VLLAATLAYPFLVRGVMLLLPPNGSIALLIFVAWIIILFLGFVSPFIFFPYRSKAAYLIALMPILLLIASALSTFDEFGYIYISDYPFALISVFIFLTISLFLIVNRLLATRDNT
jgi:hypothetical protein